MQRRGGHRGTGRGSADIPFAEFLDGGSLNLLINGQNWGQITYREVQPNDAA